MNKVTAFRLGIRIFGTIVLVGVTGTLVSFLTIGVTESAAMAVVIQTLLLLLFFSMIYSTAWKDGYTEMNRVQCGFTTFDPIKGLKAGLVAIIPLVAFWALMVALSFFGVDLLTTFRFVHFFAIHLINYFIEPGVPLEMIPFWRVLMAESFVFVIPVITFAGFWLGYRRFSFMELFVFKKKAEGPTKESSSKRD